MKLLIHSLFTILMLSACGSSEEKPTRDICTFKKHYKDNIFQVQINGNPINKHWYIYPEAQLVAKELAERNKCMDMK